MDTMAEENRLSDLYSWRYGRTPTHKSLAFSMTKTDSDTSRQLYAHPKVSLSSSSKDALIDS